MTRLKSPLFWKILGVYSLLSVFALGGLLLALSQSLDDTTQEILNIDTRQLLTGIRNSHLPVAPVDFERLNEIRHSSRQHFIVCDARGVIVQADGGHVSDSSPELNQAVRRALIDRIRDTGLTVQWQDSKILTGGIQLKTDEGLYLLLHEDTTERFENLSSGHAVAVQTAVVAWLCGTACLAFVATTIVIPVRMLMRIMIAPEESLERRDLIMTLSERGDEFGTVARALSVVDTERQHHLRRMQEKEQGLISTANQLSAILQAMADGVIAVDREEKVLFANTVACRLMDLDFRSIKNRPLFEMIRARHLHDAVEEALRDGENVSVEFRMPQRDTYISLVVSPGADGGAVLVLHDNTEARKLDNMRRDFVSGVSHELKTPLTVIQACTDTLLDGAVEDLETARNFLQQIEEQSERLLQLILGMLQLARVESGAQVLASEPVDLREVAETTLRSLRPVAEGKNISLSVSGNDEMYVLGDYQALQTVSSSLADNAIKYTSSGGHVDITLTEDDDALIFRVTDDGIGIPLKDQVRVFERFYRVDRDRNRERGGTGLGLAIVKHLCQAMNADIALESDTGRGCQIEVRFPAPAAEEGGDEIPDVGDDETAQ